MEGRGQHIKRQGRAPEQKNSPKWRMVAGIFVFGNRASSIRDFPRAARFLQGRVRAIWSQQRARADVREHRAESADSRSSRAWRALLEEPPRAQRSLKRKGPRHLPGPFTRLAGGRGFEPRLTESESAVLPLDDPPRGTSLALRVLRPLASLVKTHLLALHLARIAREETGATQG